jgi:hypothetical protein
MKGTIRWEILSSSRKLNEIKLILILLTFFISYNKIIPINVILVSP